MKEITNRIDKNKLYTYLCHYSKINEKLAFEKAFNERHELFYSLARNENNHDLIKKLEENLNNFSNFIDIINNTNLSINKTKTLDVCSRDGCWQQSEIY